MRTAAMSILRDPPCRSRAPRRKAGARGFSVIRPSCRRVRHLIEAEPIARQGSGWTSTRQGRQGAARQ